VPAGYAPRPSEGEPRATRLAENVYRLDGMPGHYHAVFVVGDDGLTVLEAPLNPAWSEAALKVMAAVAPGKPVVRVMVTHHHGDHVAGLRTYVMQGAELVVGTGVDGALRGLFADSVRARARFRVVDAAQTFGTGASAVQAVPVPNAHSAGNLAFFLPASGILFQGDLFYIPERGPVPAAFPVTADLARAVRAHGLRVRQVVGVHGRTGTWADLQQSLRLPPVR
jgi:glyoxylase-like metal-dependent hydrolase (beta-lactamase superfamily II)